MERFLDDSVVGEIGMGARHAEKPRQGDDEKDDEVERRKKAFERSASMVQPVENAQHQSGQDKTDRSFHQGRESRRRRPEQIPAGAIPFHLFRTKAGEDCGGDEKRQRHVHDHQPGKRNIERGGGHDDYGHCSATVVVEASAEGEQERQQAESEQGRR